jgi:hypothetical protein
VSDIVERLRRHAEQFVGDMDTDTDVALFAAADEIEELRQAIWDAYGILGFDQDGDRSHKAHSFPGRGWAGFLREFATEQRADYDEAVEQ